LPKINPTTGPKREMNGCNSMWRYNNNPLYIYLFLYSLPSGEVEHHEDTSHKTTHITQVNKLLAYTNQRNTTMLEKTTQSYSGQIITIAAILFVYFKSVK